MKQPNQCPQLVRDEGEDRARLIVYGINLWKINIVLPP